MNRILTISSRNKRFGSLLAVRDFSLTLDKGEVLGIFGANGAGKTTLIRMIIGLTKPTSGEYIVATGSRIGYMSQSFSLVGTLTVLENFEFYGALYNLPWQEFITQRDRFINHFKMDEYLNVRANRLPAGRKQLLAFSISRLHSPTLLLLDEPTSGLDLLNRKRLWEAVRNAANEGIAILVSTHYLDEAFHCDNMVMMEHGAIKAYGKPVDLAAKAGGDLINLFLEEMK